MSLSRGGRGGLTKFLEKGTLSLSKEFFILTASLSPFYFRFLLEGQIATDLAKYKTSLLSNPLIMVKSWSNLQKRTELILKELAREDCDNAEKLKNIWIKDKKYLLSSYLACLATRSDSC